MLGGIGVITGWIPSGFGPMITSKPKNTEQPDSPKTDVFWAYGSKDEVIPPDIARETMSNMVRMQWFHITEETGIYGGLGHEVNDAVFADLVRRLQEAQEKQEYA